jgi:hypothetical protein
MIGAATFWFFNALNKDYTSDLRIPLQFQFDGEENVVFGKLPGSVVVNVTGGGWDLLRKSNLFSLQPLEIPLADPEVQKRIAGASLRPYVNTYLSSQLVLNFIVTDSLHLDIDSKVSKTVGVAVDSSSIRLAPDIIIASPLRLGRDSIRITGAKRYLDTLQSPVFLQINEAGIDNDYDERLNLYLDELENIDCEPNTVRVEFETERLVRVDQIVKLQYVNFPEESIFSQNDSLATLEVVLRPAYRDSSSIALELLVDYNLVNWEDSTVIPHIKNVPAYVFDVVVKSDPVKLSYIETN